MTAWYFVIIYENYMCALYLQLCVIHLGAGQMLGDAILCKVPFIVLIVVSDLRCSVLMDDTE